MNGMFFSSRGLRDLAKHLFIAECNREYNLDILAVSETGRHDFPVSLLNRLSGGIDFTWTSRPPRGRSGGILVGVNTGTMDVFASSDGEFHIKLYIRNKTDNFTWTLVVVYGAA
jgi:hypothetical protein